MVIAFIGCWLPMTAVNLVKDFKQEPGFMRTQPYLWPLMAHVIAMSTVIWNPLLFFWLTRKQKRSNLGGILTTSEIMTSLASRVHSLRSTGTGDSTNESRFKRRHQQSLDRETALATKTNNNSYTLLNNNNSSSATAKSTPYNHNNNWASPIASRNGEAHNGTVNGKDRRQHMLIQKAASLSSSQML
uniref:G-protein coupled receptors family 1 profile domain-containing protein n=1 Tax=Ditylenchus dipsaci TaxID=166011 RepID=A0A915DQL1_9BILA